MKLNKKSILALILSLAMALSLVPAAAFAEDGENAAPRDDIEITFDEDLTVEKVEELVEEILDAEAPEEEQGEAPENSEEVSEEQPGEEIAEIVEESEEFDTAEAYAYLMNCDTAEKMEEYASGMTQDEWNMFSAEQQKEIDAYFNSLLGDLTEDEAIAELPEDIWVEHVPNIEHVIKPYTNAVPMFTYIEDTDTVVVEEPFAVAPMLKSKNLMLKSASVSPTTTDTSKGDTNPNNALQLRKYVTDYHDGTYKITLEAWTIGTVITTQHVAPVDIVLVIDQSGSMEENFTQSSYRSLTGKTAENLRTNTNNIYVKLDEDTYSEVIINREAIYSYVPCGFKTNWGFYSIRNSLYYLTDSEKYEKVSVNREGHLVIDDDYYYTWAGGSYTTSGDSGHPSIYDRLYQRTANNYNYTFTYTDANGQNQTFTVSGSNTTVNDLNGLELYESYASGTQTRMVALQNAAREFIANVAKNSDETNKNRIAVVGFSSKGYHNTELLTGVTIRDSNGAMYYDEGKNYVKVSTEHYQNALQDVSTDSGLNNVNQAISALKTNGGTQIQAGMDMATEIFANALAVEGVTEARKKVVVVFTDGAPGDSGFNLSVANSAIDYANTLKNDYDAVVYAIGIFDGADPTDAGNKNSRDEDKQCNWFMQNLSSNNGTPASNGNASYYLSAADSNQLNKIFSSIASTVGTTPMELGSETVVKDIVTPYFNITSSASSVVTKLADYDGSDFSGTYIPESGAPTATISNNTLNVTGFDFKANFCASKGRDESNPNQEGDFYGRKLVIEFMIERKDDFWGGSGVPTNTEDAGVYSGSGDLMEGFAVPVVDVSIFEPTITAIDTIIYYGQDAPDASELFTINAGRDNWDASFVDITTSFSPDAVSDTADGTYTGTVTVAPESGDTAAAKTMSADAKVTVKYCTLTIDKSVTGLNTSNDENQSFIFHVSGGIKYPVDMDVCVIGSDSVTVGRLPIGNYTVTEKSGWSWRYTANNVNGTVVLAPNESESAQTFSVTNNRTNPFWLNGCSYAINTWGATGGVFSPSEDDKKKGGQ